MQGKQGLAMRAHRKFLLDEADASATFKTARGAANFCA